jgi:hypothetical protein
MNIERDRRNLSVKALPGSGRRLFAPGWYLRMRLRSAAHEIDLIERQLAGEFALLEMLPVHERLEQLRDERDELLRRLGRFA